MLEGIIDLSVGEDGTLVAHSVEGGKHELILYDLAELQVLRKTTICNAALKVSQTAICFRDVIAPGIIAMSVPSLISGLYGLENAILKHSQWSSPLFTFLEGHLSMLYLPNFQAFLFTIDSMMSFAGLDLIPYNFFIFAIKNPSVSLS